MINIVVSDNGPWWRRKMKLHRLSHPNHWNEVTPKQMEALGKMMTRQISEEKLLMVFLSAPSRVIKKLDEYCRFKLSNLLDFVGTREPVDHFIIQKIRGRKAPEPKLANMTFGEFMYVDTFFLDYSASDSDQSLIRKLAAYLYRKHVNHERPEFNGKAEESWTRKLKEWELQVIVFNYGLVRVWLEKSFPAVFAQKSSGSGTGKSGGNGWIDVFDSIVGDDIIHSDDYAQKPVIEVLRFLNNRIKESRKNRRKSHKK